MTAHVLAVDDREQWMWPALPAWPHPARVLVSGREDGDLAIGAPRAGLAMRRSRLVDLPWLWLHQVHGAEVAVLSSAATAEALCGSDGDAAVATEAGYVLSVQTADCAPVALASPEGVIGAVHAGWRGLEAGVVARAVSEMRNLGASAIEAWLGPCIHAECYAFGEPELDRLAHRFGAKVRSRTSTGHLALDVPAAVHEALDQAGVRLVGQSASCTSCDHRYYSHRARAERERQALVVWRDPS